MAPPGMAGGRIVARIPGGEGILPVMGQTITRVRTSEASIRDALQEAEPLTQQEVDKVET